jgi:signal transduction histidine kinase
MLFPMHGIRLFALLVYTVGAFAYGALIVLWAQELGRVGWGLRSRDAGEERATQADLVNGALIFVSFGWFLALIAQLLLTVGPGLGYVWLEMAVILIAFTFPPLIAHITWVETRRERPNGLAAPWGWAVVAVYVIAAAIPLSTMGRVFDPAASREIAGAGVRFMNAGLSLLFILTAAYALTLVWRARVHGRQPQRAQRRSLVTLFGMMMLLFVAVFILGEVQGAPRRGSYPLGSLLEILAKSLPLVFLFVSTYHENRFQFFDIFVKRGFSLLLALGTLALWFALVLPVLAPLSTHPAAAWMFSLALLPVLAVTPWIYTRVGRFLDHRWLGRPYSTVQAVTRFLDGLRAASTEVEAVASAERCLAEIFQAPARVRTRASDRTPDFEVRHDAVVRSPHGSEVHLLLGPRSSDAPYFSQDAALARSLADVFASVLDNLHAQQRRHAEEQRAQELSLIASRSELKALRAQINPHFLFNALNAIAGLLHRDPATADRTIEKLADVFRYTLRGSESEWTVLEDEIAFVLAYLDVEQARFGERLEVRAEVAPEARAARLPTMIVHTLVENAVKHGAAAVRGTARIEVHARVEGSILQVSVADNGPGFSPALPRGGNRSGGYGLVNIRERLAGHFGVGAALDVARDAAAGRTTVTVSIPFLTVEPGRLAGASR